MKLRCPYCKHEYGPEPQSECPYCKRGMTIPDNLRKVKFRTRKKARERREREAEIKQARISTSKAMSTRRPIHVFVMMGILAVTAILLVARVNQVYTPSTHQEAAIARTQRQLNAMRVALERFRRDCGRYPTTEEGVKALVLRPNVTNWGGKSGRHYVNIIIPDPWKNNFRYRCTNDTVTLFSMGPDFEINSGDDIHPEPPDEATIVGPYNFWSTNSITTNQQSTATATNELNNSD